MFLGIKSYILYVNCHILYVNYHIFSMLITISISSFKNSTFNIYLIKYVIQRNGSVALILSVKEEEKQSTHYEWMNGWMTRCKSDECVNE